MDFLLISMGLMALGLTVYVLGTHDKRERIMRYNRASNLSKTVSATEKTDSIIEEVSIDLDAKEVSSYFN